MELIKSLNEMTLRVASDMDDMPFPTFPDDTKFEGKMQGGLEVFSFDYEDTKIFGVKIKDEFVCFTQLKETIVPEYGKVLESLNTKCKKEHRGKALSFKLRHFICLEMGLDIMLGDIHSLNTSKAILSKSVQDVFDLRMINVETGQVIDFSEQTYERLSSRKMVTTWRVLMIGNKHKFEHTIGWAGKAHENRSLWTYANYFSDLVID